MSAEEIVSINIEDKTYNVSKSKLIEKSDYFKALYSSGMKESSEGVVQLQGLSVSGLELIIGFINTSTIQIDNETLEDLIETASFLQVTSVLNLIISEIRLDYCVELYKLSDIYGIHELRSASVKYMSCHYHPVLKRPEFNLLPNSVKQQIRDMRMAGTATLVAVGDFTPTSSELSCQNEPWSMLRYDEVMQRWLPLANTLPTNMINVRGYSSAVLDNYLFIVGGYRMTSQEIAAAHCYNPCRNEWNQIAPMNQKRSNFKLLAVNGKLYAVGGQSLCSVECYSPEADWWNFVASLPDPLAEFSACECKGSIYVMGGYTTRGIMEKKKSKEFKKCRNMNILQYCPTLDLWTVFDSCEVHIRKQHMLSVEDTIYLVGGYTHEFRPSKKTRQNEDILTVQSYSIATRDWVYLKENTSKSGLNLTCTLHNDGVYIMSRDITTSTSLEHWTSLKYNIFSDIWESFRRFPAFGKNMLLCSLYLPKLL